MVEIGPVGYEGEVDYVKSLQTGRWNGGQNEIKKKSWTAENPLCWCQTPSKNLPFFFLSHVLI